VSRADDVRIGNANGIVRTGNVKPINGHRVV
jgi:hypothetical protein